MVGKSGREQQGWTMLGPLREHIPDDYPLVRIDAVLDLSWVEDEVSHLYCHETGRPSIAPESALRLMLAGLVLGIVHDRKLMREAEVNLAIRWFAGYGLNDKLPDHSTLTRIRQRWGPELFKRLFLKTVQQCIDAGLVDGTVLHVDATLIRANASVRSFVESHVDQVLEKNEASEDDDGDDAKPSAKKGGRPRKRKSKPVKKSTTDPDCSLQSWKRMYPPEPSYKLHAAMDGQAGVVVDVDVTTGAVSEGKQLLSQLDRAEEAVGESFGTVTADAGYAHSGNYAALAERGTDALIVPQPAPRKGRSIPASRFRYDARHDRVVCPRKKGLRRSSRQGNAWVYRSRACDCRQCDLRPRCVPASNSCRTIRIVDGYGPLLRARRRQRKQKVQEHPAYLGHKNRIEGLFGEAKGHHGLGRAVRRGQWNVSIQAFLTGAAINLKRLVTALGGHLARFRAPWKGLHGSPDRLTRPIRTIGQLQLVA